MDRSRGECGGELGSNRKLSCGLQTVGEMRCSGWRAIGPHSSGRREGLLHSFCIWTIRLVVAGWKCLE
jgi:hypothetical protein